VQSQKESDFSKSFTSRSVQRDLVP